MKLVVNGEQKEFSEVTHVLSLLNLLKAREPYAVAVNAQFVPREQCDVLLLNEGDQVEILSPIQGG